MSEETTGAIGGAAQGAAAGYAIAGPYGAVVGGVLGGVMGLFGGGAARKARLFTNSAKKTERTLSYFEAAVQRRDMIRQARIGRAEALAAGTSQGTGGLESSGVQGALSSVSSQANFNIRYFDARIADYLKMQEWVDKAGKASTTAGTWNSFLQAGLSAASIYNSFSKTPTPSQAGGGYSVSTSFPTSFDTGPSLLGGNAPAGWGFTPSLGGSGG